MRSVIGAAKNRPMLNSFSCEISPPPRIENTTSIANSPRRIIAFVLVTSDLVNLMSSITPMKRSIIKAIMVFSTLRDTKVSFLFSFRTASKVRRLTDGKRKKFSSTTKLLTCVPQRKKKPAILGKPPMLTQSEAEYSRSKSKVKIKRQGLCCRIRKTGSKLTKYLVDAMCNPNGWRPKECYSFSFKGTNDIFR